MNVINKNNFNLLERRVEFINASPFPYLIIDDFLDHDFFNNFELNASVKECFSKGKSFETEVENKKWISLNSTLPDMVKTIVDSLNSKEWLQQLRNLSGDDTLVTTSIGNEKLANFHMMDAGAYLGPHVDHSYEPENELPHVLNVILFLTKDWDGECGGDTVFFDDCGRKKMSRVMYKENRAIIFLHTPYSFHGVERISAHAKKKRSTIYVDYYSKSLTPYKTIPLSFNSRWFRHGTTFKLERFVDYFKPKNFHYTKALILYQMNRLRARM